MGASPTNDRDQAVAELEALLLPVMVPSGLSDSDDEEAFDIVAIDAESEMVKIDKRVRKQGL